MTWILKAYTLDGDLIANLNDSTGADNTYGVRTRLVELNLGQPEGSPQFSGERLVDFDDTQPVASGMRVRFMHDDADERDAFFGEVVRKMREGCRLYYQPTNSAIPRYIEVLYTEVPTLLRGQEWAWATYSDVDDIGGIPFMFRRKLTMRAVDPIDSDTNALKNSSLLWVGATANRPGLWAWDSTVGLSNETIESAVEGPLPGWRGAYEFDLATTSTRNFQQTTAVGSYAAGDVVTMSFYVWVEASGVGRGRAAVQFKQSDGTTNVGAENAGTQVVFAAGWNRITVTTAAAGANTSRAVVSIRFENVAATQTTFRLAAAQSEEGTEASPWVHGTDRVYNDPDSTTGLGAFYPWYIHGEVPTSVTLSATLDSGSEPSTAIIALYKTKEGAHLATFLNSRNAIQAEAGTSGTDTTQTADAAASGGSKERTTYVTTTLVERVTIDITTLLDALRGKVFDVYLKVGSSALTSSVQLKWSFGGFTPTSEPVITTAGSLDINSATRLGSISVPDDDGLTTLRLSLLASGTGATSLDWDVLYLIPHGALTRVTDIRTATFLLDGDGLQFDGESGQVIALDGGTVYAGQAPAEGGVATAAVPPGLSGVTMLLLDENNTAGLTRGFPIVAHEYYPRFVA